MSAPNQLLLAVRDYDLAATLTSGQAFRWTLVRHGWEGVIGSRWVRLEPMATGLQAQTTTSPADWEWLRHYLQTHVDLAAVLRRFPEDAPMAASMAACRGLRLLRQEPWECLASFILSSSKQIVQIQQIISLLCARWGTPITAPADRVNLRAFPSAQQLAAASEADLRSCKMGFRAPNLLATARIVARGDLDLDGLGQLPLEQARAQLLQLPGVGEKIANCVLLFAYGFQQAFPVDVWVTKALRQLYFPKRRPSPRHLRQFAGSHFGEYAGYAQQYLFHYMRLQSRQPDQSSTKARPSP